MAERNVLARAVSVWVPVAAAATIVMLLVFGAVQQDMRTGANDPQVQMAEDAATQLDAGQSPASVLPSPPVDMARSLAPFLIVVGPGGRLLASSGILDGQTPLPPSGVFETVSRGGRSEITWAPRSGVREAAVVIAYDKGHVLAGRSLRLVEEREDSLGRLVLLLFVTMLIVTGVAALVGAWAVRPAGH